MKAFRSLASKLRVFRKDVLFKSRTTSAAAVAPADVIDKDVKPFDAVPGPKGMCNLPIIGPLFHFKPFTRFEGHKLNELMDHFHETYGPVVRANMGKWLVYVEEPADIEAVFRNEGRMPVRPLPAIHVQYCKDNGLIPGLGSMQDEEWYNLRRALNQKLMMPASPLHYLHAQNQVADDFLKKIMESSHSPEKLKSEFYKYATESISVVAFNKRLGLLDNDFDSNPEKYEILQQMNLLLDLFSRHFHSPPLMLGVFKTRFYKNYAKCFEYVLKRVDVHFQDALNVLKQQERDGSIDPDEPNFLLSLISAGKFNMNEIQMIVLDLFVAGTESTAQNLQVFLYNLARHPDKQDKLHREIQSVVGDSGQLLGKHMAKLAYLKASLKESFRHIHPTASGTGRFLPKDLVLGGYNIPAGTLVVMNSQRTAKNRKYFDRPEEFLPERWLRDEKGNRPRYIPPMAYLPFGFGPRSCVGRRFAEQEIYLATTKIIQKFRVELEPDQGDLEVEYSIFVNPKHPVKLKFTPR